MNTRNNSNSSNDTQSQPLASPFTALMMDNGKVGLVTTGEAPAKIESTAVVAPSLPKAPTRRPMAMPIRRKTPAILNSKSSEGSQESAVVSAITADTAITAPPAITADSAITAPPTITAYSAITAAPDITADPTITAAPISTVAKTDTVTAQEVVALTGWDLLCQHQQKGTNIRGHVTRVIYSRQDHHSIVGVKVRVAGLEGFVPFRMLGLCPLDTEHSVTLEMAFRVIELQKGKDGEDDRIILNRQLVITEEKSAALIQTAKIGDTVIGVIRKIKDFGAFIDINGASALIYVKDLPQGNIRSVKVGQQVTAQVVKVDKAKNQLAVSIKHHCVSQLVVGAEFTGVVKNEEQYGVFVRLNESVDGLVHVSQFGDFTPTRGNIVTVKVRSTNPQKGQVQLALLDVKSAQAS